MLFICKCGHAQSNAARQIGTAPRVYFCNFVFWRFLRQHEFPQSPLGEDTLVYVRRNQEYWFGNYEIHMKQRVKCDPVLNCIATVNLDPRHRKVSRMLIIAHSYRWSSQLLLLTKIINFLSVLYRWFPKKIINFSTIKILSHLPRKNRWKKTFLHPPTIFIPHSLIR